MSELPAWHRAASFAARAHRHHTRKDGKTPYVAHVYRVALVVRHVFACDDEIALVAALLHDTIEDTPTDYDDISRRFGDEVAECVAALTKNMLLPEASREVDYDRRLAVAPWQARLVKLADAYDNALDVISLDDNKASTKATERCKRALKLARSDMHHPAVARAVGAVEALLKN